MKIKLLTTEDEQKYSEYLLKHPSSLFNASLVFKDFIHSLVPDAIPYYFMAYEEDELVGVLPSFMKKGPLGPVLNSLPWFGSNPGAVADDDKAILFLLQAFYQTAKWTGCFSSTFISPPNQNQELYEIFFNDKDEFSESRIGLITELPVFEGEDQFATALIKKVHQKTRNQIIKSIGACMAYESYTDDDWNFLKQCHRENMSAVGGSVKSKEFDVIRKRFKKGVDYKLYVALTNDDKAERIAALLIEYFNNTVEYITPVIEAKYRHLCPMHLLIFSAMGDAAQKGMKFWNWGGTKLPSQNGLYHFKKRFGATESEYKYYTQIYRPLSMNITPKWLVENYKYFYVLPYNLLDRG